MNATAQQIGAVAACFVTGIISVCWQMETRAAGSRDRMAMANRLDQPETKIVSSWDQKAAAAYLDQRAAWWMEWPKAARDHESFCVSCHTAVPYALSRPALRKALAEEAPSINERRLLANVKKRVRLWKNVGLVYQLQGYVVRTYRPEPGTIRRKPDNLFACGNFWGAQAQSRGSMKDLKTAKLVLKSTVG